MKRSWKIILGIIAGIMVVLIIICISPLGRFVITGGLGTLKEQPFNAEQWKEVESSDPETKRIRLMMLDDLMENGLLTGKDSTMVKEMLGEPERIYGFSYGLGTITEGIDPIYLIIDFDSLGKVSKLNVENEGKLKGKPGAVKITVK